MIDMSPFPAKLTARQQQILDLIQSAIARTGAPPTRAEIATELGFKSANACLLYTSPSPRDRTRSRMPSSA